MVFAVAGAFWPGVAMYDTVAQYGQVLSGEVDDWHPPVMVRFWQLLHGFASGTAPMFLLQVALYAAGFALIIAALARSGRWRAAIATALLALSPLLLGWQMVVLKDAQMLGSLIAALGVVAHYRLANRKIPAIAAGIVASLIAYATLVRANALFATVPLAILLLARPRSKIFRAALIIATTAFLLAGSSVLNHWLFKASPSGVERTQALFDLAAIAVVAPPDKAFAFGPAERAQLIERHCVKDFFWDPLGESTACGPLAARLNAKPELALYVELAREIEAHPEVYVEHRLRHWNSTERWLVAPGLIGAEPPDKAEPNDIGLGTPPSPFVPLWQAAAAAEAGSPPGWPIVWTLVALVLLPAAWRRRGDPAGRIALALLASALMLEASFLVISIASDLRYHLWSMTVTALALILLADDLQLSRRERIIGGCGLLLVLIGGVLTRAYLPRAPDSYQGMLHAASG